MAKNFMNSILVKDHGYNRIDLTNDHKLSLRIGQLVPVFWDECIPGDKWHINTQVLLKFLPMIAPVMHRFNVFVHYFFVPFRILWPNFEDYITHGGSNTDGHFATPLPVFPNLHLTTQASKGSLLDYLGIPPRPDENVNMEQISAMPLAAYQMIYSEYYRNQNFIDEIPFELIDGENTANTDLFPLRFRAWEKDYYTSALPWAQKGLSVDIPLGDVTLKDLTGRVDGGIWVKYNDETTKLTGTVHADTLTGAARVGSPGEPGSSNLLTAYDPNGTLGTTPTTITDLRRAFALQRYFEKLARSGTRYKEFVYGMFGVNTGDARVDRPEYITGVRQNVVISEVLQTGETAGTPQGNMAGHGIAVQKGGGSNYYVREHGLIMGIMSVMPKTAYQNGIPRKFLKITDPTEFFTSDFEHIGEQEIVNREVFAWQSANQGSAVWGYIPRYAEYKHSDSQVHGELRDTLAFWQGGRIFDTPPALSSDFITCTPEETARIFAVEDGDNLVAWVLNDISAMRKVAKYGNPI